MQTFRDIVVGPTQEVLRNPPGGAFFRGGPIWPRWPFQVTARQCRGPISVPRDARPRDFGPARDTSDDGVWCGPLCWHYGHSIADFGMRIAASAEAFESPDIPLVFSAWADPSIDPAPYFWSILDQLRVERTRVLLIRAPTRFRRLHVLPQEERMSGGGPSARHLARMSRRVGDAAACPKDLPFVYASRAGQANGRVAGESYLDDALTDAGVRVFHPEFSTVPEQAAMYARAGSLIFAEGSAVHTLQLMGRVGADVSVLRRRPHARIAAASLKPRAKALRYLDALQGLVHGLQRCGKPYRASGISVLRQDGLFRSFRAVGVDLAPVWDEAAFVKRRDADLGDWMEHTRKRDLHPKAMETAEICLDRMRIRL